MLTRFSTICGVLTIAMLTLIPDVHAAVGGEGQRGGGGGRSRPGSGDSTVFFVPWRYMEGGVDPIKGPLILYWLPASREEMKHSELLSSRKLTALAAECIAMAVVLPEDAAMIEKLGATGKRPQALLVGADGKVVRRTENVKGALKVAPVEHLVEEELSARDAAVYAQFSEARQDAAAGQRSAAVDLFTKVWEQRCMFPVAAGEAQRALKDLGVIVSDAPPPPAKPTPALTVKPVPGPKA